MQNDKPSPILNASSNAESTLPKVYSAPRRFDIFTLMVVTVAYAFLFMLASLVGTINKTASVWFSAVIGLFLAYVAVAQVFLFQGKSTRLASMVAGVTAVAIWLLVVVVRFSDAMYAPYQLAWGIFCSCVWGAGMGYLAGATVGGVFLISDVLRRKVLNRRARSEEAEDEESW
jgi:hypothetical protein